MVEYVMFHKTKWDDICDENGNIVMPRYNQYWLEGFWGLDDCKSWIQDAPTGSRCGALTMMELFAVAKDKMIDIQHYIGGDAIVCVKTAENIHRWNKVETRDEATAFIQKYTNVTASYFVDYTQIELHEVVKNV